MGDPSSGVVLILTPRQSYRFHRGPSISHHSRLCGFEIISAGIQHTDRDRFHRYPRLPRHRRWCDMDVCFPGNGMGDPPSGVVLIVTPRQSGMSRHGCLWGIEIIPQATTVVKAGSWRSINGEAPSHRANAFLPSCQCHLFTKSD